MSKAAFLPTNSPFGEFLHTRLQGLGGGGLWFGIDIRMCKIHTCIFLSMCIYMYICMCVFRRACLGETDRDGFVFQDHSLVYHSTYGLRPF